MFHLHPITTLDLPELAPYRTMRRQEEHRQRGVFVAEGEKVVRRLLESAFGVESVLMPERWLPELERLLRARPETVEVYLAEKRLLENLTGFSMYQGLLAVGKVPEPASLEDILTASPRPWLLAAVDGLSSAENLGAVVRNCAGFGVQALLVGETSTSPFLRRAVRSSMGTVFQLPVVEMSAKPSTLKRHLELLRQRGIRCIAAHPHAEGKTLSHADFTQDCCIVFGSEGYGISESLLESCDDAVAIPMAPGIDSLNVSSAAAVFLYEARRQRTRP